jgi:hypothetical protein
MESWISEGLKKVQAALVTGAKKEAVKIVTPIIGPLPAPGAISQVTRTREMEPEAPSRVPLYIGVALGVAALVMFLRGRK